jgi:hypothetical protein
MPRMTSPELNCDQDRRLRSYAVAFNFPSTGDGALFSREKQRQFFFLGMGIYGGLFMVNVMFLIAYEYPKPHIAVIRILAAAFTVPAIFLYTVFLRYIGRKQLPDSSVLLSKWPVNIPDYPTWMYGAYTFLSLLISGYLLSRL